MTPIDGYPSHKQKGSIERRNTRALNALDPFINRARAVYGPEVDIKLTQGNGGGYNCLEVAEARGNGINRHYLMPVVNCTESNGTTINGCVLGDGSIHELFEADGHRCICSLSQPDTNGQRHHLVENCEQPPWVKAGTRVGDVTFTKLEIVEIGGPVTDSQMDSTSKDLLFTLGLPQTLVDGVAFPEMVGVRK
jgi:hypothetical protein